MAFLNAENLTIEFPIYNVHSRSFRKSLFGVGASIGGNIHKRNGGRATVTALDDITMRIGPGERVGVLGQNGAGKSTFLRALGGIYTPTSGDVESLGSIVPMFDISLGMDPDLDAYENIRLRALILGFSEKETEAAIPEIERFTELGEFMRIPIRTYSTGMTMRLSFAISSAVNPDILLMDEWLTTGDARFIDRVERRMMNLVERSKILVIATHAVHLLPRLCTRGVILHHGKLVFDGDPNEAAERYQTMCAA